MTNDLLRLKAWLNEHGITHVAMESTGVYWKPVFNILEDSFEVLLVNARHVKHVPGRKTDVLDSEWLCHGTCDRSRKGAFLCSDQPYRPIPSFCFVLAASSGLTSTTRGNSSIHSYGRHASIRPLVFINALVGLRIMGSRGVLHALRMISMSSPGSDRVQTAHSTSFMFVGSISSSTTITYLPM